MRTSTYFVSPDEVLPGRSEAIVIERDHLTLKTSMHAPFPEATETAYFGMGCFWGAERLFYELDGVVVTAAGYQGGATPNPTYQEVCSGRTNHTEVVLVVFDPTVISYEDLVRVFFENHDPTQGMRQGADVGTQYRSAIYTVSDHQDVIARRMATSYDAVLRERGIGSVTTEIAPAGPFYYAEEYHQQYLTANPNGYCGIGGTGVACPVGVL
jgi:peptide-methionine (S)-S-oxide reductase